MYRSSLQSVGQAAEPDYVYYNADIINNTTADQAGGRAVIDPQVRFNETRDTAIIKNAADYYFSIIRFTMDGANKDLPLFIPTIQQGTGQTNPNLTTYSMAISYNQTWNTNVGAVSIQVAPAPRFVQYVPETQNPISAPVPFGLNNPEFRGVYAGINTYNYGDIVSLTFNPLYGNGVPPFYQVITPPAWSPTTLYGVGAFVLYAGVGYRAIAPPPVGVVPIGSAAWVAGITGFAPAANPQYWALVGNDLGVSQDLTTRYYWVYTYQHWVNLTNQTILNPADLALTPGTLGTCCYMDTFNAFYAFWIDPANGITDPFPYATLQDFVNVINAPKIVYSPDTDRFRIYGDSDGFGERITAFTPTPYAPGVAGSQTPPVLRLFFNANMYGLYSNFDNTYWNDTSLTGGPFAGAPAVPEGYTNEILFTNKFYQNVADYRIAPYSGVPPLGYVPLLQQKVYWIAEQDYSSTDSLWSPVSSIVFTSTLLPVKTEATGAPVVLGNGNLGFSAPTTQSAFQPIITDISLDTSSGGAKNYRQFIYYAPSAEYRLSDFSTSKQDIRNIDIQVYWKNRLDNNLYPINMFNLSSVSIKVMFRRKSAESGAV